MDEVTKLHGEFYLSDRDLSRKYGVSRSTIWRWVKEGRLPEPVKISPGTTRWPLSAVEKSA